MYFWGVSGGDVAIIVVFILFSVIHIIYILIWYIPKYGLGSKFFFAITGLIASILISVIVMKGIDYFKTTKTVNKVEAIPI